MNVLQRAYSILGLKNSSGTPINPATEDKQDDLRTVIEVSQQDLLEEIVQELKKMNMQLSFLTDTTIKEAIE